MKKKTGEVDYLESSKEKSNTHFITISKEEFDKVEAGDRLVIQNDENKFCQLAYLER